ncbi:MAG: riboflavin synthase [Phycisphaerae bacterium]
MFTGLIQYVGKIAALRRSAGGAVFTIDAGPLAAQINLGDSVAVNGCCLTAISVSNSLCDFDVSAETLRVSTAAGLRPADSVNLELAMSAGGRFGGHIVQGHVDSVGRLKSARKQGNFYEITFSADKSTTGLMVPKGSVCVDGISLTIASLGGEEFSVAVIPETYARTNLHLAKPGTLVNIEADVLVKAIRRQLEVMLGADGSPGSLTMDKLRSLGF